MADRSQMIEARRLRDAKMNAIEFVRQYGDRPGWTKYEIAQVHLLGDDVDLVKDTQRSSEDCFRCDFWWAYDSQVYLVQIGNYKICGIPKGARIKKWGDPSYYSIVVGTNARVIDSKIAESVFGYLESWIKESDLGKINFSMTIISVTDCADSRR